MENSPFIAIPAAILLCASVPFISQPAIDRGLLCPQIDGNCKYRRLQMEVIAVTARAIE